MSEKLQTPTPKQSGELELGIAIWELFSEEPS